MVDLTIHNLSSNLIDLLDTDDWVLECQAHMVMNDQLGANFCNITQYKTTLDFYFHSMLNDYTIIECPLSSYGPIWSWYQNYFVILANILEIYGKLFRDIEDVGLTTSKKYDNLKSKLNIFSKHLLGKDNLFKHKSISDCASLVFHLEDVCTHYENTNDDKLFSLKSKGPFSSTITPVVIFPKAEEVLKIFLNEVNSKMREYLYAKGIPN